MAYVLQNLPYFLILIGPLIFFHELGHFTVAKLCGVRVLRFSLGFGPKIFGFKRGETDYVICAIPLGGYVKMWGDDPTVELQPEERRGSFLHQALFKRAAIVAAGPVANLALAAVVYAIIYMGGVSDRPTKLGVVLAGEPADRAGLVPGDEVLSVDGVAVRYWSDLQRLIQERPGKATALQVKRGDKVETVTVTPRTADERDDLGQRTTRGKIGISPDYVASLVDVPDPASPAGLAGLEPGDEITAVNDQPVSTWFQLEQALKAQREPNVRLRVKHGEAAEEKDVQLQRAAQTEPLADAHLRPDPKGLYSGLSSFDARVAKVDAGSPAAKMGLQAGDRLVAIEGRAITAWRFDLSAFDGSDARKDFALTYARGSQIQQGTLRIEQRDELDELKQKTKAYVFGAENDPRSMRSNSITHDYSVGAAVWTGLENTWHVSALTLRGLGLMVTGKISVQNVGGPVMLFVVAQKSVARGWATFFHIMAVISINLGLMNLLPVPVLDGGHLVFFAAEGLGRRPIPLRVREYANVFGLVLLLLLMALALFNDSRFFMG